MQLIGFNYTKIEGIRNKDIDKIPSINTDVQFIKIEKENVGITMEQETMKVSFSYIITYAETIEEAQKKENLQGSITFNGNMILAMTKDEAAKIMKDWKKEQINVEVKAALINILIRKCTAKAIQLEEDLHLPFHVPLPLVQPQSQKKEVDI
ncbi:MAG TPA: hypothetical protein VJK51_04165 [Candidatus Nanoarchaeia archaeon]|nr:hypothetical protein [Candidatus Nanoarchaeia archaeon]